MLSIWHLPPHEPMPDIALRGLPSDLHRALKEAAERNHRSLNGEILARLEASLRPSGVDVDALLARVARRKSRSTVPDLDPGALRNLEDEGRSRGGMS